MKGYREYHGQPTRIPTLTNNLGLYLVVRRQRTRRERLRARLSLLKHAVAESCRLAAFKVAPSSLRFNRRRLPASSLAELSDQAREPLSTP